MSDLGDRFMGTTFYTKFTTVNASGTPTTLGNTPSLQFYVGAGATAFTVGLSLDVDFNSKTGLNHVTVIATTSATAWTSGIDVQVIVAAGTVSGISMVGYKVCEFSLMNRAALRPATAGRNLVVDSAGLADANMVKLGPTGSGTAQTARDIGTSVLLSSGTGTGQLSITSGIAKVDVDTIKTNPVVNAGTITFPTTATLASTTNITAGTVTTATNVTTVNGLAANVITAAATAADFSTEVNAAPLAILGTPAGASMSADIAAAKVDTAAIKTKTDFLPSATAGAAGGVFIAGSNAATSITTALTSNIVGNVTGNLSGSVGSVTGLTASDVGAIKTTTDKFGFTVANLVDSNILRVDGVADAADRLQRVSQGNVFATVGAASTTTSIVTSAMDPAAAVTDQFKGRIVTFKNDTTTANLRGQSTDITGSTALGVLTVTALTDAPVSGDVFTIS